MTELMLDDPLKGLEDAKAGLEDALAMAPLLPVEVTASHPAASVTVDAWGALRTVEVTDPVASRTHLTTAFADALAEAFKGLRGDTTAGEGAVAVTARHDRNRPFPSALERIGAGSNEGFDWQIIDDVLGEVEGNGDCRGAHVTVRPGSTITRIHVSQTAETGAEMAAWVMTAAKAAVRDAIAQVEQAIDEGRLRREWAAMSIFTVDPYEEDVR